MDNKYDKINYEMNDLEKQHNSLKTIINMLIKRRWIEDNFDKYFNKIKNNDLVSTINIQTNNYNIKTVVIKFYNDKLNTKNDKDIDNFISTNIKNHKILLVNDISSKAEKQLEDVSNLEIFKNDHIIQDISKHHLVPEHNILSKEDAIKLMDEYKFMKKDMGLIYKDDPMAKYLYAKEDDIIQIIRPSIIAGYSTYYRLVVNKSIFN